MNEALKSLRSKKLISQQDIADRMGISRQTYNNYETDVGNLSIGQLENILNNLNATDSEIKEFFYTIQQDILSRK